MLQISKERALLERLRGEFLEMPGLRLTLAQAQRLCGIDPGCCKAVLDALVEARFLCLKPNGMYARLTDSETVAVRPVKAALSPDAQSRRAS